jgi:hypothetical protein
VYEVKVARVTNAVSPIGGSQADLEPLFSILPLKSWLVIRSGRDPPQQQVRGVRSNAVSSWWHPFAALPSMPTSISLRRSGSIVGLPAAVFTLKPLAWPNCGVLRVVNFWPKSGWLPVSP